jgi:hypothetical protein
MRLIISFEILLLSWRFGDGLVYPRQRHYRITLATNNFLIVLTRNRHFAAGKKLDLSQYFTQHP